MRLLWIILFIGVTLGTLAQTDKDRLILRSKNGIVTDTLTDNSFYFIKNDTLTRFLIAKSSSPDNCSSFSIMRELYKNDNSGFEQLVTRTIRINSKCSSLWSNDAPYCIRLEDFKLTKGTARFTLIDSNDKKLKIKIIGDNDFEIYLKDKVDKFIDNAKCNGVRIE